MRILGILAGSILAFSSVPAYAHGGGLNSCGCHFNRKTGACHCHRNTGCGCECQPASCSSDAGSASKSEALACSVKTKTGDAKGATKKL
jgi:hypothetical protein